MPTKNRRSFNRSRTFRRAARTWTRTATRTHTRRARRTTASASQPRWSKSGKTSKTNRRNRRATKAPAFSFKSSARTSGRRATRSRTYWTASRRKAA